MLASNSDKHFDKNQMIFSEGEPVDTVYIITSGKVKLYKVSEDGKDIILNILHEGDIFCEDSLFTERTQAYNAMAIEETNLETYDKSELENLILKQPKLAIKIIKAIRQKLDWYTDQITDFGIKNVRGRLENTLLRIARDHGKATDKGLLVDLRLTHEDLASLVGASRVMVTNELKQLRKDKILHTEDRKFIVNVKKIEKNRKN